MIKKEYMTPAMEVCQADTEMRILANSVSKVNTPGLDEAIEIDDTSDNPWNSAW